MKIDKNSDIGKNLLETLADAIPELRDAIKNGDINIDSIGIVKLDGKEEPENADDSDDEDDSEDEDKRDYEEVINELTETLDDPDLPEKLAAPTRVILKATELMDILNPIPVKLSPVVPFTARRATMMKELECAIQQAAIEIIEVMSNYSEFKDILEKHAI